MKKVIILAVALVLVAAGVSFAAIANGKHDLTAGGGYSGSSMSSCQYCHTPHLRSNPNTGAPLWNRTLGNDGSWTMYGTTLGNTSMNTNPGSNSRTCLSCHDGSVAVGSVTVGNSDTITKANVLDANGKITSVANLGVDLSNEHPIGFTFVANRGGVGASIPSQFPLYSGTFECATCHDPHGDSSGGATAPFLRANKSTICSDCHTLK